MLLGLEEELAGLGASDESPTQESLDELPMRDPLELGYLL